MAKMYEMKSYKPDPFDLMCSDCEVNYIPCFEKVTEEDLREEHHYMVLQDMYEMDYGNGSTPEEWKPTEPDFEKWLQQSIENGEIRVIEEEGK